MARSVPVLILALGALAPQVWSECTVETGGKTYAKSQFTVAGADVGCPGGTHLHATNGFFVTSTDGTTTIADPAIGGCGYNTPGAIPGMGTVNGTLDFNTLAGTLLVCPAVPVAPIVATPSAPATSDGAMRTVFQSGTDFAPDTSGPNDSAGDLEAARASDVRTFTVRDEIAREDDLIETLDREKTEFDEELRELHDYEMRVIPAKRDQARTKDSPEREQGLRAADEEELRIEGEREKLRERLSQNHRERLSAESRRGEARNRLRQLQGGSERTITLPDETGVLLGDDLGLDRAGSSGLEPEI